MLMDLQLSTGVDYDESQQTALIGLELWSYNTEKPE